VSNVAADIPVTGRAVFEPDPDLGHSSTLIVANLTARVAGARRALPTWRRATRQTITKTVVDRLNFSTPHISRAVKRARHQRQHSDCRLCEVTGAASDGFEHCVCRSRATPTIAEARPQTRIVERARGAAEASSKCRTRTRPNIATERHLRTRQVRTRMAFLVAHAIIARRGASGPDGRIPNGE
jgi:hypothetical protein